MNHISVEYVIVCDDARTEDNGKNILIGVFRDSVPVAGSGESAVFPLSLYFGIAFSELSPFEVNMRLEGPKGDLVASSVMEGTPPADSSLKGSFIWKMIPVHIPKFGEHRVYFKQGDVEEVVHTFEIKAGQIASREDGQPLRLR